MFARLGLLVSRHWLIVILIWISILVAVRLTAPAWDDITYDGDFAFLPADMPSVMGERLTEAAFPDFRAKSQIVLVLASANAPLQEEELAIGDHLARRLHNLLAVARFEQGRNLSRQSAAAEPSQPALAVELERRSQHALATAHAALDEAILLDENDAHAWHNRSIVRDSMALVADAERDRVRALELDSELAGVTTMLPSEAADLPLVEVWSRHNEVFGEKLVSRDKQAILLVLQLRSEFMATENIPLLGLVEELIDQTRQQIKAAGRTRLQIGISGSAAVGGDMLTSAAESIANTEWYAIILVIVILLLVYRAPLLVVVPLATIAVSLTVATGVVAALTQMDALPGFSWWDFKVFKTTRIFVIVILFGTGTDFCLFLIARFREELQHGTDRALAIAAALDGVGDSLVASALTTILGLAMMFFADFGKFSNSGPAIGICLTVTLLACLTLAPAIVRGLGNAVFWPWDSAAETAAPRNSRLWIAMARWTVSYPGTILSVSVLLLLPLAVFGLFTGNRVTFDLLSELSPDRPSIRGSEILRRHFPVGESGPIIVLARKQGADFEHDEKSESLAAIFKLTEELSELPGVIAVRSLVEPLGDPPGRLSAVSKAGIRKLFLREHRLTKSIYLAQSPEYAGDVTRFELVMDVDPFSKEALDILNRIEARLDAIHSNPASFWSGATFAFTGTTAGIRDLRTVTRSDQLRIQVLVVIAVLAVLWFILRHLPVCLYLIASVVFSYLVTIGITEMFFQWSYGDTFHGLDWKVPVFLFVILVAVGEDYNIYLVTRVFEEQARWGPFAGLRKAIVRTGGIITSCGVIMAGTFVSMTSGSLRGIVELGFALSLGVLVDTFVVRTILVPAFLALWCRMTKRKLDTSSGVPEIWDNSHEVTTAPQETTL
jgi:RND superfamily putative drug exporter